MPGMSRSIRPYGQCGHCPQASIAKPIITWLSINALVQWRCSHPTVLLLVEPRAANKTRPSKSRIIDATSQEGNSPVSSARAPGLFHLIGDADHTNPKRKRGPFGVPPLGG